MLLTYFRTHAWRYDAIQTVACLHGTVSTLCRSLLDLCRRTRNEWLSEISENTVHENLLDDVLQQIENSNGQEEDAQKFWQELERLQAVSPVCCSTIQYTVFSMLSRADRRPAW